MSHPFPAQVAAVDGDDNVSLRLRGTGENVECGTADCATWAVPVLADGRDNYALPKPRAAVAGRAARYLEDP